MRARAGTGESSGPSVPAERLRAATRGRDAPFAVVDACALDANAADLTRRAAGKPLRLASKSLRCRQIQREVLDRPGFEGILAYNLREALWLAADVADVVVGYPTADHGALRRLAADPRARERVTLMVDSRDHLELAAAAVREAGGPGDTVRICMDLDASLRVGGAHLGVRRSPVRTPADARALALAARARPELRLVGLMAYEAQIAGLPDHDPAHRLHSSAVVAMQSVSARELRRRRAAVVAAVREVADLEFVNGGGTGSVERTTSEAAVTEVAAGSGLYGPTLFDGYRAFHPQPAAFFAVPVVRRPAEDIVTVAGGGWIASGPTGVSRQPTPVFPAGLSLLATEGAGEVQSPLQGEAARTLRIGDCVWFRHAKAGELCEHVPELLVVDADANVRAVPTYRGEGMTF